MRISDWSSDVCSSDLVLAVLQDFEPTGIFARSLAECLALQLKERDRYDPAMQTLVEHLDLLARGEHARLMKLCGIDHEDLAEMIAEIKVLDPRPALSFEGEVAPPVIPDVLMRADRKIGRAHVCTPVTNAHLVCRLLLEKKK